MQERYYPLAERGKGPNRSDEPLIARVTKLPSVIIGLTRKAQVPAGQKSTKIFFAMVAN